MNEPSPYQFVSDFEAYCILMETKFLSAPDVPVGEWQSQKNVPPELATTRELEDHALQMELHQTREGLANAVKPNLPWAEEHFLERVGGEPLNPPPSHERWPHRQQNNEGHMPDGRFSHTYPERFWPKLANAGGKTPEGRQIWVPHVGIRFAYGDLGDVVDQLGRSPATRQAYLPVWFPEDTGAVHGERVPCTLGYLFRVRRGRLNCTYYIRSCDFLRHFRDDVYMAGRLVQWVCEMLDPNRGADVSYPQPGRLTMHVGSFHVFAGDVPILEHRRDERLRGAWG